MAVDRKVPEFWRIWRRCYGEMPPLAHLLRQRCPDRWCRAHTLPGSRRYPDNAADWSELLFRYRKLAAEVLREDEPCWLVQAYSHDTERSGFGRSVVRGHEQLIELGEHMVREGNGEDCPWRFYGAPYTWNFHRHGQLWWDIADGLDGYVLMVSAKTGAVFAPYDGGVDLFLGGLDVAALRARYRDWLSPEPSGL